MVLEVNDDNFRQEVLKESKNKKVIIDFWAGWCMPCKVIDPIFSEAQKSFPNAKFVKINVDKNPKISLKYDIVDVPCIKIFENERISKGFIGYKSSEELKKWLSKNIKTTIVKKTQ